MTGKEVVPAGEIDSRTERILWREIGKTPLRQIAEQTGLSVEAILRLKNEIIDNVDVLTIEQRRMKLIIDLQSVSDRAREMAESVKDERTLPGLLQTSVGAMKTILAELRNLEKQGNSEVEVLNALRQREIVQVYEEGHMPFIEWLVEEKGLDREELEAKSQMHILEAARKMDERHDV